MHTYIHIHFNFFQIYLSNKIPVINYVHYNFDTYCQTYKKVASIYTPTNSVNTQNLTSTKLTVYIIDKQYKFSKC